MKIKILFYTIDILTYPLILLIIVPCLVSISKHGGSDAAGSGMEAGYLMLYMGVFLLIITVIAGLIISKMCLQSFIPAWVSLVAGLILTYAIDTLPELVENNKKHEYVYYYDSGKIREQGSTIGELYTRHGELTYYDEAGRIEKIETWNRGKLNGMYCDFYENGVLKSQGKLVSTTLNNEYKSGEWKFYRADGQLDDRRTYKKGELRSSLNYKFFVSPHDVLVCAIGDNKPYNGKLDKTPVVSESVLPYLYSGNVIDGDFEGLFIAYYVCTGQPIANTGYCVKGVIKGKFISYYENGQLKQIENYADGKLNGDYISYYSDSLCTMPHGQVEYSCFYTDGECDGTACWYESNGKLKTQIQYSHGKVEGFWRTYDTQTGEMLSESFYKNDNKVSTKTDF
jgi:antitoxin component YwqK of YwqJK toxin-antitoxin module